MNEKVRINHHDLHKKHEKCTSILNLQTEAGLLEGHEPCAQYMENEVGDLPLNPAQFDQHARDVLLGEVEKVFTEEDNQKFLTLPSLSDVKKRVAASNLLAAPGTDGVPSMLYSKCWNVMGTADRFGPTATHSLSPV